MLVLIGRLQLGPLGFHERCDGFLNKLFTLPLRFNGVQEESVLNKELPKILSVLVVVFVGGVPFAEMLGDFFTASRFSCDKANRIAKKDITMIRSGRYKKYEPSDAAKKIAPKDRIKDRIKAADAAVKRAKDTPL